MIHLSDRCSHKATLNQHHKCLMPNPIYDGPMYETIPQPSFNTLELFPRRDKAVASKEVTEVDILPRGNPSSSNFSPTHKPLQMSDPLNMPVDDNIELCAEGPKQNVIRLNCPNLGNAFKSEVTNYATSVSKKSHMSNDQDAYTLMSPLGIISPSLNAGWDGKCPENQRNLEQ